MKKQVIFKKNNVTLNIEKFVISRLNSIIGNPDFKNFSSSFIYPKSIEKHAILFLGINPSISGEQHKLLASYELKQTGNSHPYFKRFEDISTYCRTKWTHLDLLFFRETNQTTIHHMLKSDIGVKYIWDQLQIADFLIKESKPKVIVVSNALARRFLGFEMQGEHNEWLDYRFEFDDKIGTYRWEHIPVFFTSMLTGQRALDNGSYERLKWHIKRTLTIHEEVDTSK